MAQSSARFTIGGIAATDTFAGYDAALGDVLDLQLEQQPPLGVNTCVYSVPFKSKNAPDPVLSNSGVASPPSAVVTMSLTSTPGVYAYLVRCQTNGGAVVKNAEGKNDATINTFERIVVIRSFNGARKVIVGEIREYDTQAWVGALNEFVDALEDLAGGNFVLNGPLTFAKNGTYTIQQTAPDPGDAPGPTLLAGQDAPSGDLVAGPDFMIRPGRAGDGSMPSGNLVLELGEPDGVNVVSGSVSLRAGSVGEFLRIRYEDGAAILRAPTGVALVLSQEDVSGETGLQVSGSGVYLVAPLAGAVRLNEGLTPTVGPTITISWGVNSYQVFAQAGAVTLAAGAMGAGQLCILEIVHDGNAIAWSAAYHFPGGVAPALTLTAGKRSILQFLTDGAATSLRLLNYETNLA